MQQGLDYHLFYTLLNSLSQLNYTFDFILNCFSLHIFIKPVIINIFGNLGKGVKTLHVYFGLLANSLHLKSFYFILFFCSHRVACLSFVLTLRYHIYAKAIETYVSSEKKLRERKAK